MVCAPVHISAHRALVAVETRRALSWCKIYALCTSICANSSTKQYVCSNHVTATSLLQLKCRPNIWNIFLTLANNFFDKLSCRYWSFHTRLNVYQWLGTMKLPYCAAFSVFTDRHFLLGRALCEHWFTIEWRHVYTLVIHVGANISNYQTATYAPIHPSDTDEQADEENDCWSEYWPSLLHELKWFLFQNVRLFFQASKGKAVRRPSQIPRDEQESGKDNNERLETPSGNDKGETGAEDNGNRMNYDANWSDFHYTFLSFQIQNVKMPDVFRSAPNHPATMIILINSLQDIVASRNSRFNTHLLRIFHSNNNK